MSVVTPLVGVWIEIHNIEKVCRQSCVTPLVGVWIEIGQTAAKENLEYSHSPCGSVD